MVGPWITVQVRARPGVPASTQLAPRPRASTCSQTQMETQLVPKPTGPSPIWSLVPNPTNPKPQRSLTHLVSNPTGPWSPTLVVPNPRGPEPNWSQTQLVPQTSGPKPVFPTQVVPNPSGPKPTGPKPIWFHTQVVPNSEATCSASPRARASLQNIPGLKMSWFDGSVGRMDLLWT